MTYGAEPLVFGLDLEAFIALCGVAAALLGLVAGIGTAIIRVGLPMLQVVQEARDIIGERRQEDDPTLMQILTGIYHELGDHKVRMAEQDETLHKIVDDLAHVQTTIDDVDFRVDRLEHHHEQLGEIDRLGREHRIDRRTS